MIFCHFWLFSTALKSNRVTPRVLKFDQVVVQTWVDKSYQNDTTKYLAMVRANVMIKISCCQSVALWVFPNLWVWMCSDPDCCQSYEVWSRLDLDQPSHKKIQMSWREIEICCAATDTPFDDESPLSLWIIINMFELLSPNLKRISSTMSE